MLAAVIARGATVSSAPSGWSEVAAAINFDGNGSNGYVYERIADSESGSYTWEFGGSIRAAISINAFSGVDTTDAVESSSNSAYTTNDTTIRSASVTTTAANQLVVNFALLSQSTQLNFTPATDFTEHHEYGGNRCWSEVSSRTYASAGATGDIDVTMSGSSATKRGIALVLKNASAAAAASLIIPSRRFAYMLAR
ncbi:MAG: hypothetical protein MUC79_08925 [Thiobacillaceae bacterium]|jgi:hypothetical protein|nr:hypothetical protein [Thiobacillaceae bacterium]